MQYDDFTVRFESRGGSRYKVKVESTAGNDSADIELSQDADALLSSLRGLIRSAQRGSQDEAKSVSESQTREVELDAAQSTQSAELGEQLYEQLFSGAAGSKFDQALGNARGRDAGLRVRIHIDPNDPEHAKIGSLPWEVLCHPNMGGQPLSLSRATPVVRYIDSPRPLNLQPFRLPLRILVVVSNPQGVEPLDLEAEKEKITASWGDQPDVEVRFLPTATVNALSNEIARDDYHVLHFMGHGDFDERKGVGTLLMETEDGEADPVDGQTLGVILNDASSVRMVFLNACDTAKLSQSDGQDPYAGIATAMILAGVPSVIAMQFPVSDKAAISFAGCLYPRLAQGFPLDSAVTEARKAIRLNDRMSLEWATPVLFMRAVDGVLFDLSAKGTDDKETRPAPAPKTVRKRRGPAIVAGMAFVVLAAGVAGWKWYESITVGEVILSGQIVDRATKSSVVGATVQLTERNREFGDSSVTDEKGNYELFVSRRFIGRDNLELRVTSDDFANKEVEITLDPESDSEVLKKGVVELLPSDLAGCSATNRHTIIVGSFQSAGKAPLYPDLPDALSKAMGSSLLPSLQESRIAPDRQPTISTCPGAKPEISLTSNYAKALKADVLLHGDVIQMDDEDYKVNTYLGDRHDVLPPFRLRETEEVELLDPARIMLSKKTHGDILLILARSYELEGMFVECVEAMGLAERLEISDDEAIEEQNARCKEQIPHTALYPGGETQQ